MSSEETRMQVENLSLRRLEKEKLLDLDDDETQTQPDKYGANEDLTSSGKNNNEEYTFEDAVEHFGFGRFQIRLGLSVGLTLIADAAQLLAPSILGTVLECTSWKLSKVRVAWLTTIVFFGMITFSPFVGWIIDGLGRKFGILLFLAFGAVFTALGSFSPSYPWLLASRFLVGAALAGNLQVFGYMEEFLSVAHRRRAMLIQLFWPIGGLWASSFGLLMIYHLHLSWNWYMLMVSSPLFLAVLFVFLLPESARFLGARGKFNEVGKILQAIGRENKTGLPHGKLSRESLSSASTDSGSHSNTFSALFARRNLRSTILLSVLWFAAGFLYYGIIILVTTFNQKNKSSDVCTPMKVREYTDLIWTGFAELPGTMVAFYLVEFIGRKRTMMVHFFVVLVSLIPFFFAVPNVVHLICLLISRAFTHGVISSLVIYTPEVFSTSLRGKGVGMANLVFRVGAMATPFFSQVTVGEYFDLTIGVYLGVCMVAGVCTFFLPKETQGMALED